MDWQNSRLNLAYNLGLLPNFYILHVVIARTIRTDFKYRYERSNLVIFNFLELLSSKQFFRQVEYGFYIHVCLYIHLRPENLMFSRGFSKFKTWFYIWIIFRNLWRFCHLTESSLIITSLYAVDLSLSNNDISFSNPSIWLRISLDLHGSIKHWFSGATTLCRYGSHEFSNFLRNASGDAPLCSLC
jgi:hypothetical protein